MLFFRYHRTDGVRVGDREDEGAEFDFAASPRITRGVKPCGDLGVRVRWFDYNHTQDTFSGRNELIAVDAYNFDIELFEEFALLEFLLYNKNRVLSRLSIAEHVWGDNFDMFSMTNFVDVHIKNLRKKIARRLPHQDIIHTVYGLGYQFLPPE